MPWDLSWSVTGGARGARRGHDENRVYQHEQVRFTLHLRGTNQRARDFVLDARNWSALPQMRVTGLDDRGADIRTVEVASARDSLLDFDYDFAWAGRKRIEFSGVLDLRRADAGMHGGAGARATTMRTELPEERDRHGTEVYATYPPLSLNVRFEVIEEAAAGAARATVAGEGRSSRSRDRLIDEERAGARAERRADAAAEREDREVRDARAEAARERLPTGILRMPPPWTHLLTDAEIDGLDEHTMGEYARDLRAAIRVTPPVVLDGNHYFDGRHHYRGRWTWAHEDGGIVFFFLASQVSMESGGMRACDDAEAARARARSAMNYDPDDMIVARLPGQRRKVLSSARAFARDADWARLTALIELVDHVMTAFDIVEIATGAGAIIAGVRRAAAWLVRSAGRLAHRAFAAAARHADDIGRAGIRALGHADDAARSGGDVARGVGGATTASGDDVARGVGGGTTASGDDVARGVADDGVDSDAAFDAMTSGARGGRSATRAAAPEPYVATEHAWSEFRRARREFARLQRRYARRLGLRARSGAQVHHAIELNVIARYGDDIFTVDELNSLANMRGIVPERTSAGVMHTRYGLRQLHNSAIRRRWDQIYQSIDRVILDEGLVPGTAAYRQRVRSALEHGREVIDAEFSALFSGSGAGLPAEFVDEATDAALRGGRSSQRWTPGMLPEDAASIGAAVAGGVERDLPPALRPR